MANEMKFIISAVDNASQVMGKVSKSTQFMAAAAGAAIVAFGAASVKAYAQAEASQVKLEQAYRKFPAIASVSIQSMRDLNSAIQAKTGADDDQLAAAQATLAQFKLTGEQIQRLTPLLVDYATVTRQDVTSAASTMGKAFMGNARALKAIGIDFKATGDTAKDFETIMGSLEQQVGGAGEAFGQTAAGQMQILQESFSDLQEEVGAQLAPALKGLTDIAVPLLQSFGKLPDPVKSFTVAVGAAAAAALLLGPRLLSMAANLKLIFPAATQAAAGLTAEAAAATTAGTASATASTRVGMLAKALGPLSIGIAATIAVMEGWQAALDRFGAGAEGVNALAEAMKAQNAQAAESAINSYKAAQAASSWQAALALTVATGGAGLPAIVQGFRNAGDATANLDQQLAQMVNGGSADSAVSVLTALGMTADEAREKFPEYAKALDGSAGSASGLADATGDASDETENLSKKMPIFTDKAKRAKDAINALKDALDLLGGKQISVDGAMSSLQQAIDDAAESTSDLEGATRNAGSALNLQEPAGRSAQEALAGIAQAADDVAAAQRDAGVSTAAIVQTQKNARAAFIAAAEAAGLTAPAAKALADSYGLIPDKVGTEVSLAADEAMGVDAEFKRRLSAYNSLHPTATLDANGNPAENVLDETERRLDSLNGRTIRFTIVGQYTGKPIPVSTGGYIQGFDVGGRVSGPGTGTSDSVPAMLSNGEYVVRAAAVSRIGLGLLDDINDDGVMNRRRYAVGGPVTPNQRFRRFETAVNAAIQEEQELRDLLDARRQSAAAMKTRQAGFASISNSFDTGAYAGAQKDVEAAQQRLNMAATPQAAAAARADLEAAQRRAADTKPTTGNLIKGLRARMRQLTSFASDLKALVAKKKIPTAILRDIIDAGPEEGGQLAKALLSAKTPELDELVKIQARIDEASAFIGQTDANLEFNPLISNQRQVVNRAVARATAAREEFLAVRTQVTIDGRQIAEALANYKRAMGGRKLGLD